MRFACFSFAALYVGVFANSEASQCCCSGAEITTTDGFGNAQPRVELKLSEIPRKNSGRIAFRDNDEMEAKFNFQTGCANGRDTSVIESGSSRMRVRFKIYGEFGHPKAEIVFTRGDYVA